MKPVEFLGPSLDRLRKFPQSARRKLGQQIDRVQQGLEPDDWKPMLSIGAGVREIRVRDEGEAWRAIYIATFSQAVYVLHCFQKKTRKTAAQDIALASESFKELASRKTRRAK